MFKKGSFEIGGTIYPVTIKVRAADEIPGFAECWKLS